MVLFLSGGGRFGNQLLRACVVEAIRLEYPSIRIINIPVLRYGSTFQNVKCLAGFESTLAIRLFASIYVSDRMLQGALWACWPIVRRFGFRHIYIREEPWHWVVKDSIAIDPFNVRLGSLPSVLRQPSFISGWNWFAPELIEKYSASIRERIKIRGEIHLKAKARFESFSPNVERVIGIHIRRTDYLHWAGGRYFFSKDEYVSEIEKIVAEVYPEMDCSVFLFGDDVKFCRELIASLNKSVNATFCSSDDALIDFLCLSMCPFILSAPSTFACLAAFYGRAHWSVIHGMTGRALTSSTADRPIMLMHTIMASEHSWPQLDVSQ